MSERWWVHMLTGRVKSFCSTSQMETVSHVVLDGVVNCSAPFIGFLEVVRTTVLRVGREVTHALPQSRERHIGSMLRDHVSLHSNTFVRDTVSCMPALKCACFIYGGMFYRMPRSRPPPSFRVIVHPL